MDATEPRRANAFDLSTTNSPDIVLSWPRPAATWEEAAPVGNGRIGAMVFGGSARARWQINDSTVWSGTPDGPARALAAAVEAGAGPAELERIRQDVRAGRSDAASRRLMAFEGPYSQEFMPLVDVTMTVADAGRFAGRTLNLDAAVAEERFEAAGAKLVRRTWSSYPDRALCIATDAESGSGTFDTELSLSTPHRVIDRRSDDTGLGLVVEPPVDGAPSHETGKRPWTYRDEATEPDGYVPRAAVALHVVTDGSVTAPAPDRLTVTAATFLLAVVATSTSGELAWLADPGEQIPQFDDAEHRARAAQSAVTAAARGTHELLQRHIADFRGLVGATQVRIGEPGGHTYDVERDILGTRDPGAIATVMCQFGRYLLASSSRANAGPPANLQGIWNADMRPPWSSNYTLNINTEMNYWACETAGLGPVQEPLARLTTKLAAVGRDVARELYGARGWVAHHNTDMWGWAMPVGAGHSDPSWAVWQMGGIWLADQLWEHYEFSQDRDYLEEIWPVLRGACEFALDWLVEGDDGYLDTNPSTSPENHFLVDGRPQALSRSTTMDIALIRKLFSACLAATRVLGRDDLITARVAAAAPRLRPFAITADGRLAEWSQDFVDEDRHHRHMSQAVALYPLGLIDPDEAPELAAAVSTLIDSRGAGGMGWSWAWRIALRARLGQGNAAADVLEEATRPYLRDPAVAAPVDGSEWGGLLPNLFSTHPPVQLDANFGFTAAILELLVQSQGGVVRLLPALPDAWPSGQATGIRARGGLSVDLAWRASALTRATVTRQAGTVDSVTVLAGGKAHRARLAVGQSLDIDLEQHPTMVPTAEPREERP